jgi:hypothetical protein
MSEEQDEQAKAAKAEEYAERWLARQHMWREESQKAFDGHDPQIPTLNAGDGPIPGEEQAKHEQDEQEFRSQVFRDLGVYEVRRVVQEVLNQRLDEVSQQVGGVHPTIEIVDEAVEHAETGKLREAEFTLQGADEEQRRAQWRRDLLTRPSAMDAKTDILGKPDGSIPQSEPEPAPERLEPRWMRIRTRNRREALERAVYLAGEGRGSGDAFAVVEKARAFEAYLNEPLTENGNEDEEDA